MNFTPVIDGPVAMDPRLFRPEPMRLKAQFLEASIESRITLDADRDLLLVNLRGYAVRTGADLEAIAQRCEVLVAPLGRKVDMVAWYDGFTLDPALDQAYADMVAAWRSAFTDPRSATPGIPSPACASAPNSPSVTSQCAFGAMPSSPAPHDDAAGAHYGATRRERP